MNIALANNKKYSQTMKKSHGSQKLASINTTQSGDNKRLSTKELANNKLNVNLSSLGRVHYLYF